MILDAGSLDQRVTLQRATETIGAMGGVTYGWSTIGTVWAQVKIPGGKESSVNEERTATRAINVIVRWSVDTASLTPKDRLQWNGSTYDISRADPYTQAARGQYIYITAEGRSDV